MKVKLLPLAVTAAIAMPGLALADGPTVYGKMNLSLENVDYDDGVDSVDNWQVISNSSRVGVKGDAKINSMLKATYLAEWGVSGDGDGTDLSERNRSVGLAGNFGALDVGKFDTPLKTAQGKVDQFNDLSGDLQYVLTGENRADDIIQYTTPDMNGLQGKLAIIPGEQFDDGNDETDDRDGLADSFSASLGYTTGQLYLAIAHDSEVQSTLYAGLDGTDLAALQGVDDAGDGYLPYFDTTRLVGQFTTGALQLGVMYQMAETSDSYGIVDGVDVYTLDSEQDGFLLSGAYTIGQTVLKAQYTTATTDTNIEIAGLEADVETDAEMLGLGVDQKLSAQTTVFGYYNMLSYEDDTDDSEEQSKDNLGVGIVHVF